VYSFEGVGVLGLAAWRDLNPDIGLTSCFLARHTKGPIRGVIEPFIRKQLRLTAHAVTEVEETNQCMLVHIDRLVKRL